MRSNAAVLLAGALACSHAATEPQGPAVGERFTLSAGESAAIRGTPLTITFERILSDSRCAIDVVCIHAGEARAAFRVEQRGGPPTALVLDTDQNQSRTLGEYRMELSAVFPPPRSTVRTDPRAYVVEISVSR